MFFSKLAIPLAFAASALAQTFSINTPASLVQCQPAQITWVGGTSPYILAAIPAGQVSAAAIETIDSSVTSSPYTWTVNLASGTNLTLKLTDSAGNLAYSSPLVIQAGTSDTCLNASASTSGLSTAAVTTTVVSSGTASATSSASTVITGSSASSVSNAISSSAAAASSSRASTSAVASSSAAATSAAASSTSHSGAMATAIAGLPALAAGLLGGVAVLL